MQEGAAVIPPFLFGAVSKIILRVQLTVRIHTPTRSEWMSRIHTSIRTVSRLFRAISRAVSRYFASFADGVAQDLRLFRACFACDSRVDSRHGVLHATTNGRGMNFHPFAKFSICSSHLPLQGTYSPQHLWCVQLSTQDFPRWPRGSFVCWRIVGCCCVGRYGSCVYG